MRFLLGVVFALAFAGCLEAGVVVCANGLACPSGTTCVALSEEKTICATQTELDACIGIEDDDSCTLPGGAAAACLNGVCLAISCGNGRLEIGEACDDGNTVTGDGTCSADCLSNERCGNGVVDPLATLGGIKIPNEQCDDGNLLSGDGCSSRCANETPLWSQIGGGLPPLSAPAMAYDSSRRRVVVFGGLMDTGIERENTGTFEWNGRAWAQVPTTIAPLARRSAQMAYDASRHRIVLFGGHTQDDDAALSDTWEWDGGAWSLRTPAIAPPQRTKFGMVYDAARKRVVLFGGFTGDAVLNDAWAWDGTNWTEIAATTKPPARFSHVMAYDPKRAVIVVAGGTDRDFGLRGKSVSVIA